MTIQVQVKRLPHSEGLALPSYATAGAAGMDLLAAVQAPLVLQPGARTLVPTGLAIALPPGFELQVRPRSGLALKNGINKTAACHGGSGIGAAADGNAAARELLFEPCGKRQGQHQIADIVGAADQKVTVGKIGGWHGSIAVAG